MLFEKSTSVSINLSWGYGNAELESQNPHKTAAMSCPHISTLMILIANLNHLKLKTEFGKNSVSSLLSYLVLDGSNTPVFILTHLMLTL